MTATLIKEVEAIGRASKQGIWPVITPRFIPSCTDEVLRGLGDLCGFDGRLRKPTATRANGSTMWCWSFGKTDPYALRDFGLVNERTIMAHCPYVTEEEGEMFAELGVAIAHVPMANS